MFQQLRRRRSASALGHGRRNSRSRFQVEPLEGRTLLTLTPIDFGASITSMPVAMNGKIYFSALDVIHGDELWKSDGTSAGTSVLDDIRGGSYRSTPRSLTVVGN